MASELLTISGLSAGTEDKPILHDIDLSVGAGETHVLMGPNGAGKSTLGHVIMGDPVYKVSSGTVTFDGQDVTDLAPDRRSLAGIFLSYQAPVEVPGVPLYSFLRTICQMRPELKTTARKFRQRVGQIMAELDMDESFLTRELNVGFSGGEKKKVEMLQLLLLRPKLAILDETDSGLDVDALSIVSKGIEAYRRDCDGALLMITHNTRILERLNVDRTHVMVRGHLVAEGPASMIDDIDRNGFGAYEDGLAASQGEKVEA
ncbi:Fe-S cluster assembly ATPase SufC [Olsenella porci]|jgi:Fe-S cluster assembly ATP-binding protein|uniref:Fe-S cluster assembly ATPase SufC n=1 Tax=Olsenella porci TaxID=2652279 RepID=A0A6N7XUJ8_9ACTN|nr:Fe-S cluster assembly ATPase SufC [Olsenella porci]MCI1998662.1 Fe-S cluster assembly ATPase SufC [Olsenella sp.]MST73031.1 Fe-S cluster assembly ATPase SufC [Olsenella porci]